MQLGGSSLSGPSALHNYGPRHHVVHGSVVLEEEEADEEREEEGNGEVLVQGPHGGPAEVNKHKGNLITCA